MTLRLLLPLICTGLINSAFAGKTQPFSLVGGKIDDTEALKKIEIVEGPKPGIPGFSASQETTLHGRLDAPLSPQGSVSIWFRLDQKYQSGSSAPDFTEYNFLKIPGAFSISFIPEKQSTDFYIGWGDRRDLNSPGVVSDRKSISFKDQNIRILLPGFPGPGWHNLTVVWNSETGLANACLDGTPYFVQDSKLKPWKIKDTTDLEVNVGKIALADIRFSSVVPAPAEIKKSVGMNYTGQFDEYLGSKELDPINDKNLRGELLYSTPLARPKDTEDWKLEGPGLVSFQDGWMQMKSSNPDDGLNGSFVYWLPKSYPDRFLLEFDFEILSETGLNIIFFAAKGQNGLNVFDASIRPRKGVFMTYTNSDLNNYHISYFANMPTEPRRTSNMRKNSGFYLVSSGPVSLDKGGDGQVHHAILLKESGHIRMAVDGRTVIDFTDDGKRAGAILQDGQIAFRQMSWTIARYRDLKIYGLK